MREEGQRKGTNIPWDGLRPNLGGRLPQVLRVDEGERHRARGRWTGARRRVKGVVEGRGSGGTDGDEASARRRAKAEARAS